jgi:hypothetical protein
MKRTIEISFENCLECPNLVEEDGYASHSFFCPLIHMRSSETYGGIQEQYTIDVQLKDWFENRCTLGKVGFDVKSSDFTIVGDSDHEKDDRIL